jgi:protein-tyrosine phosphatase
MHQIKKHLFLGSKDDANNVALLKKYNITHFINLSDYVFTGPQSSHYDILDIIVSDSSSTCIFPVFEYTNRYISRNIRKGVNVLVFCTAGISRSSTVIIAYLIKSEKLKVAQALEKVRRIRSIVNPNRGFLRQLKKYASEIT